MATETEVADLPTIGFGTFDEDIGSEAFVSALTHALKAGYRHVDTAEMYQNTVPQIAKALQQSEVPRASVFITTKLKGTPSGPFEAVEARLRAHLSALSVEYVDLLLIHWPGEEDSEQPANFDWFKAHIASAWENMIRLKQLGLARRIGVSNFYKQHITELLALNSPEKPFANQLFIDLTHQQQDYVAFLQSQDIRVIAYRAVAYLDVFGMFPEGEQIQAAAERHAVDTRQLVLALLISRGISVLVRSSSPEHIDTNFKAVQLATSLSDPSLLVELDQNVDVIECGGEDDFAAKWQQ